VGKTAEAGEEGEGRRGQEGHRRSSRGEAGGKAVVSFNIDHTSVEVLCQRCLPRCLMLGDGLHYFEAPVMPKHHFPGKCESCHAPCICVQHAGLASSQADFVECHSCNRWLCVDCRQKQSLGACTICPAKQKVTNYAGPVLRIPAWCQSEETVQQLSQEADQACHRASTGKFSSGKWAAGALAIPDRGRGPRVAKQWLGCKGRHAPPPQMGEAEGGEAEGSEAEGGEAEGSEAEGSEAEGCVSDVDVDWGRAESSSSSSYSDSSYYSCSSFYSDFSSEVEAGHDFPRTVLVRNW